MTNNTWKYRLANRHEMVGKKKKNLNGFTSDAVAITVVNLFDGSIPEGKLPHPVNSAANTRRQAQAGIGSGRVKAVRPEIIITNDEKTREIEWDVIKWKEDDANL